jgi:ribose transport system substrate-binding protein
MRKISLIVALMLLAASGARAEGFSVGYSPKFLKDDFQVLLLKAVQKGLTTRGWKLAGAPDANGNVEKQVSDLENLIAGGANALILVPYDGAGVVPAIKKANEAKIPVFAIDDGPSGGQVFATVRADNVNAGAQGAEEMVRRLKKSPKWPNVTVLELQGGLLTVTAVTARTASSRR